MTWESRQTTDALVKERKKRRNYMLASYDPGLDAFSRRIDFPEKETKRVPVTVLYYSEKG